MGTPEAAAKCSARSIWTPPSEGRPGARVRLMGHSMLFACPGMENTTVRHAVTLMCATGEHPLRVDHGPETVVGQVLLIQPMARKVVLAANVPLVLIDMEPSHPQYRRLANADGPAVRALEPGVCSKFLDLARAFEAGILRGRKVDSDAAKAIDAIAGLFPVPVPASPLVRQLMAMLDEDPGAELDQLAERLGISPHHASRLFCQGTGIALRRYALSVKICAASSFMGSGLPLTQIAQAAGFVDSAHFAKVWLQCYGAPPSQWFPVGRIDLDTIDQPDWLLWYLARRDRNSPAPSPSARTPSVHRRAAPAGRLGALQSDSGPAAD